MKFTTTTLLTLASLATLTIAVPTTNHVAHRRQIYNGNMEDTAALHRSNADAAHAVGQQQQHLALEEAIAEITAALEKSSSGSESESNDDALAQVLQALLDQLQEIASAADITKEAAAQAGELQVEIAAAEAKEEEDDEEETDSETEEEVEVEEEDTFAGLGNKDGILLEEEDVILPTATFTDGAILMPTTSTTATAASTASTTSTNTAASTATVQKRDLFDDTTAFVDALSDGTAGESIHRRRDDEAALERHMARVMA